MCILFIGCTRVELCDFGTHPHQYGLHVTFNWPSDLSKEERPDSMYILANRLYNTIRYQFSYNLLTAEGRLMSFWSHETGAVSTPLSRTGEGEDTSDNPDTAPEEIPDVEEDNQPDSMTVSDFSLRSGQYQMLTFNHTDAIVIDSLDRYMTSNSVKSSSLGISYHQYAYPQFKGKPYTQWTDFNKGYNYVENVGPLVMAQETVNAENQSTVHLTFAPEILTQEITFDFDIQLSGRNVVVDSVRAEVSGVSRSIKLFTKYIDMDATQSCRMIFDAVPASMGADSLVTCSGKIHVPGLMNSEDETMKTGPGLLYIAAYVHAKDTTGGIVRKTCYAGINLRSYLLEQPLTQLTEDGYHHIISQPKVTIHIESRLPISMEEVLGASRPEENIEYWFKEENGKGDYDLEV